MAIRERITQVGAEDLHTSTVYSIRLRAENAYEDDDDQDAGKSGWCYTTGHTLGRLICSNYYLEEWLQNVEIILKHV